MRLDKVVAAESGLNMTPMIDIVFQLILFFLFNLRFKSLDYRIETELPHGYGTDHGPVVDVPPHVKASLARLDAEDPSKARTRIRLGGSEWIVPDVARASDDERERVFASLGRRIAALHASVAGPGEIDTPAPWGGLVPHADVVKVIDSFLGAGVTQVDFVGAAPPVPARRR